MAELSIEELEQLKKQAEEGNPLAALILADPDAVKKSNVGFVLTAKESGEIDSDVLDTDTELSE